MVISIYHMIYNMILKLYLMAAELELFFNRKHMDVVMDGVMTLLASNLMLYIYIYICNV